MATKNDITGDSLITKPATDKFRDGWDTAFTKPPIGEDTRPKDRIKQGISSSTIIEEWDCTDSAKKPKAWQDMTDEEYRAYQNEWMDKYTND
mgnify:CR=1 FL=1